MKYDPKLRGVFQENESPGKLLHKLMQKISEMPWFDLTTK